MSSKVRLGYGVGALVPILVTTGLFRASENALQTSFAPFGHYVLHYDPSVIGVVVTFSGAIMVLSNLLIASKIKPSKLGSLLIAGLLAISASFVVLSFSSSLPLYILAGLCLGISSGLSMPLLSTLAGRLKGISRDRALTAFTVALSGSLAIGPALESLILKFDGGSLRIAFLFFVPLGLAGVVFTLHILRSDQVRFESSSSVETVSFSSELATNLHLRLAIIGQLINQIPFIAFITFGVLLAHSLYGVSNSSAQLIFTTFFGVAFVIRIFLVARPQVHRTYFLLKVCTLLMIIAVLSLAVGRGSIVLFVIVGVLGVPHGLLFPLTISLVARGTESKYLSRANASLFTAISLVSVVFPILLGVLIAHFGYRIPLIFVAIATALLGLALFQTIAKLRSIELVGN